MKLAVLVICLASITALQAESIFTHAFEMHAPGTPETWRSQYCKDQCIKEAGQTADSCKKRCDELKFK